MQGEGELQAWEKAERISQEIIIAVVIKKVIITIMYVCRVGVQYFAENFNQAFLKQL